MDTQTLIIIILLVLLLGGGGWYGRGRWFQAAGRGARCGSCGKF